MANISKQDLQGARKVSDIEQKYNFGKRFSEIAGIADGARKTAEKAQSSVNALDTQLTQEEIFNRLTNNGQAHGIFRGENGEIYINAEYIVALSALFSKDITMTGKLTNTVEAYLPPGDKEIKTVQSHVLGVITIPDELIPLYDFSGDGKLTSLDCSVARKMQLGVRSMADWPGAIKTPVTMEIDISNPEKAIRIRGTNMWGREVDEYIGITGTTIPTKEVADFVVEEGDDWQEFVTWHYRKWNSGIAECWGDREITGAFINQWGSLYGFNKWAGRMNLPAMFVDTPQETVTARAMSSACFVYAESGGNGQNTASKTAVYNVARPTKVEDEQTVKYSYYVVGRWK